MAKIQNKNLERISINIPSSIVSRVKEYADKMGINYTSAYIILLNQALDQKDMLNNLPLMYNMFNDAMKLTNNDNIKQIDSDNM